MDLPRTGFVGPWAMLDVFVMSVLVALVKLGEPPPLLLLAFFDARIPPRPW
jgi:hypothetical protein